MSFREDLLDTVDEARAVTEELDIRLHSLTIVTRHWVGDVPGAEGGYSETSLVLPARYRVVPISTKEIAQSGGRYQDGDIRVGPITPVYTTAQLAPEATGAKDEIRYVVIGPHGGIYTRIALENFRAFSWFLTLHRTRQSPRLGA